jgi:hypothetical protein
MEFVVFVKNLLPTTAVKIPAYMFRLPHGPPFGLISAAHVQVY